MNNNPKEKPCQISVRTRPKEKERIRALADKCGLSVSEYMVKRALGYEPKEASPDAFFRFHDALCELLNKDLTPQTEAAALRLFDAIYAELIDDRKQTPAEIQEEVMRWRPPDSGPSSAG